MDHYPLPPPLLPDLVSSTPMDQIEGCRIKEEQLRQQDLQIQQPPQTHQHQQQQQPQQQPHQQQQQYLPPPPQYTIEPPAHQLWQQPQLPDLSLTKVIEEIESFINDQDKFIQGNAVCLLYRYLIDIFVGEDFCRAISALPGILNGLYSVLTDEFFKNDDSISILQLATGSLKNISNCEEGRVALLNRNLYPTRNNECSKWVELLIHSLESSDNEVIVFAITAVWNLLRDTRSEVQRAAKRQIKSGAEYIVHLLDNRYLMQNYEFKVIVLDCLQMLAHDN